MKLPLILDYEIYDEDGPCAPYFTGRITDADGRVMCNAENEERAVELVDHVAALRASHTALCEAVEWLLDCLDAWRAVRMGGSVYAEMGALELLNLARAEVDRLLQEEN